MRVAANERAGWAVEGGARAGGWAIQPPTALGWCVGGKGVRVVGYGGWGGALDVKGCGDGRPSPRAGLVRGVGGRGCGQLPGVAGAPVTARVEGRLRRDN